jgi:hypothetical protein
VGVELTRVRRLSDLGVTPSALEGGTHWHYLARAAYEAIGACRKGTKAFPMYDTPYEKLAKFEQEEWKAVALAVAREFGGKINGNLVSFENGTSPLTTERDPS